MRKRLPAVLIGFGIILGIAATGLYLHDRSSQPQPPREDSTSQQSAPSAVKPSKQAVANYSVPAANPKYIAIPAIGVSTTRVIRLGLTQAKQIAVPNNIYDAGWYDGSAKPGQNGAMFIYGHVSSWQANGIFHDLKKLKAGDRITITRGDNKTYVYRVVSSKVYPHDAVPMNTVLAPIDSSKPGLNLMTCTGSVIKGTSEFSGRLVVFTSLVSS